MIDGHGGNIFDKARELGCHPMEIIDMSSNVNPLGPMPELMTHLHACLDRIVALPEANAGEITRAFANHHGIDPDTVLAGNGTTQLIHILPPALKTRNVLVLGPTYSDYADACRMHDVAFRYILSEENTAFHHRLDALVCAPGDAVFICNPNNPTGTLIAADAIITLCQRFPGTHFIIDESYLPFVPNGESNSLIGTGLPNLIVLNSMSKIFRIPGLRIGFVVASADIIERIRHYMMPWSVNTLAQAAVNYLMTHDREVTEFIEKTRRFLAEERQFVTAGLQSAPGIRVFPSVTSFILMKLETRPAESVCQRLLADRILIRNCCNFDGLSDRFIRISLKTRDINQMFIKGFMTG
jgi:threonine-phosphate decarboxylase